MFYISHVFGLFLIKIIIIIFQVSINIRDPYPVMFYIHGGDFDHGASNQFPGHMLAAWGEVVVVTINYRLGALGNHQLITDKVDGKL